MDGVLADFDKYCLDKIGRLPSSYPTNDEGWDALGDHRHDMYSKLEMMPDAQLLLENVLSLANKYLYRVSILTAIPKKNRIPAAIRDKRIWCEDHIEPYGWNIDFNIGPYAEDKWKHCMTENDILIDDSRMNIADWNNKTPGYGIIHVNARNTIDLLRYRLYVKHTQGYMRGES